MTRQSTSAYQTTTNSCFVCKTPEKKLMKSIGLSLEREATNDLTYWPYMTSDISISVHRLPCLFDGSLYILAKELLYPRISGTFHWLDKMTCLHSCSSQSRIQEDRICISLLIREIEEEEEKEEEEEEDISIDMFAHLYFALIFLIHCSSTRFQSSFPW